MIGRKKQAAGIGALMALAACGGTESTQTAEANTAAAPEASASAGGVTRDVVEPEAGAPVAPLPAETPIQSQPGPSGSRMDLMKVAVTGDILTVTFRCSSDEKYNTETFKVADIAVIDDATSQRIGVLKDNAGKWMVSTPSGDYVNAGCEVKPGMLWAKFPAPPATSRTISIALPDTGPFDGVPVTR